MLIIVAELAFWGFIAVGMALRYIFNASRAGAAVLFLVPVIDLVLLGAVINAVRGGVDPNLTHQLAGLYLAFSVILGSDVIRWCDRKAAAMKQGRGFSGDKSPSSLKAEIVFLVKWTSAVGLAFSLIWYWRIFRLPSRRLRPLRRHRPCLWPRLDSSPFLVRCGTWWRISQRGSQERRENEMFQAGLSNPLTVAPRILRWPRGKQVPGRRPGLDDRLPASINAPIR